MVKKILAGIILVIVVGSVIFLALQGPRETVALSTRIWEEARRFGYQGTHHQFRSDFHIVEYFAVGAAMILFFSAMGWKRWAGALFAILFGLLEETLKIWLPTREFSWADVGKDCIGVCIASALFFMSQKGLSLLTH